MQTGQEGNAAYTSQCPIYCLLLYMRSAALAATVTTSAAVSFDVVEHFQHH
jgi:pyrrolidone-carboxylate peptidase